MKFINTSQKQIQNQRIDDFIQAFNRRIESHAILESVSEKELTQIDISSESSDLILVKDAAHAAGWRLVVDDWSTPGEIFYSLLEE